MQHPVLSEGESGQLPGWQCGRSADGAVRHEEHQQGRSGPEGRHERGLLCICMGMEATLEEIQSLLRQAGYAEIYPKIKRDAIICHGILHKRTLSEINDTLFAEGERTLF